MGGNGFTEAGSERSAGVPQENVEPRNIEQALTLIEELRGELARRDADVHAANDRTLRQRAELENFKKRMQKDKADALRYATEPLLSDLLPVIDNLERAVKAARTGGGERRSEELTSLVDGIELVLRQFGEVLARAGVERIAAVGQPFDPAWHEALVQVESDTVPPGSVVDEHQAGYRLHDRLLRPAGVSVAKAPPAPPGGTGPGPGSPFRERG